MDSKELTLVIEKAIHEMEELIPAYLESPVDKCIADGNLALCIIDEDGIIYGRMYGADKARQRRSFKIAWTKASQVWLTGYKTGAYERMVFNKEVEENANGIEAPDLIGWEGGQPVTLLDGTRLSIGFSGFRGTVDLEIVVRAFENAQLI